MKFENLTNEILNNNRVIKVFLSGSGLRIARVDDLGTKRIYGEGINIMTALTHADENCIDNLDYQGQYVVNGKHDHYLTGSPIDESDILDYCLFFGKLYLRKCYIGKHIKAAFVTTDDKVELSTKGKTVEDALLNLEEAIKVIGVETLG